MIIAEIGQNHNGDMVVAKELIHAVAAAGAQVAKFQLYDAQQLFSRQGNPWFTYNCQTELSFDQVASLAITCQEVGVEFMASVFDLKRLGWVEQLHVRRHKVASRSVAELELVESMIRTGKQVIVSLGHWQKPALPSFSSMERVEFLHCISKYPADIDELNLASVDFGLISGVSDHTPGITGAIAAVARGARIVEKHVTLDKTMYGPDHTSSITPGELAELVVLDREIRRCL